MNLAVQPEYLDKTMLQEWVPEKDPHGDLISKSILISEMQDMQDDHMKEIKMIADNRS